MLKYLLPVTCGHDCLCKNAIFWRNLGFVRVEKQDAETQKLVKLNVSTCCKHISYVNCILLYYFQRGGLSQCLKHWHRILERELQLLIAPQISSVTLGISFNLTVPVKWGCCENKYFKDYEVFRYQSKGDVMLIQAGE